MILSSREVAKSRLADSLLLPKQMQLGQARGFKDQFQDLLAEYQNQSFTEHKYQAKVKLLLITLNEMVLDEFSLEKNNNRSSLVSLILRKVYEELSNPELKSVLSSLGTLFLKTAGVQFLSFLKHLI